MPKAPARPAAVVTAAPAVERRAWHPGFGVSLTMDKGNTILALIPTVQVIATSNVRGLNFEFLGVNLFVGSCYATNEELDKRGEGDGNGE